MLELEALARWRRGNAGVCLPPGDLPQADKTMYYVYVLKCHNSDLYIGFSSDLRTRIKTHQLGKVRSTKSKLPVELIYYEAYKNKVDATMRERNLKTGQQRELLKHRLKNSV